MIIAINTRMMFKGRLDGIGRLSFELVRRLAARRPDDTIYCVYDRKHEDYFDFGSNVHHVSIGLPARHPILWKLWFDFSIPHYLKKIKADRFISLDGYHTLKSKVPSIIIAHDIAPIHFPQHMKSSHARYYKKYLPLFLNKADAIVANSAFTKKDIVDTLGIDAGKIEVATSGLNHYFQPLDKNQIAKTKNNFTSGNPYFIFTGTRSPRKNLPRLISAFELFKSKNNLSHQLLIVGRSGWKDGDIVSQVNSSAYSKDIQLLENIDDQEIAKLVGAAAALVFVSLYEGFGLPIIEAMACHVPVITSDVSSMPEVAGDAAIIVDPYDVDAIAQAMTDIVTDESLRSSLIVKGGFRCKQFNWDDQADMVHRLIDESSD